MGANLVRVVPACAINFSVFEFCERLVSRRRQRTEELAHLHEVWDDVWPQLLKDKNKTKNFTSLFGSKKKKKTHFETARAKIGGTYAHLFCFVYISVYIFGRRKKKIEAWADVLVDKTINKEKQKNIEQQQKERNCERDKTKK